MKAIKKDYNHKRMLLITYDSSPLKESDKVRFYYALKGRDGISGIVKLYSIDFLGKGVLLVPFDHLGDIKQFLAAWKLPYTLAEITMDIGEEVIRDE